MKAPRPSLARGDRAPDFLLPNAAGKFGRFYDRFRGNPVVLLVCPRGDAGERLLGAHARRAAAFEAAGARLVGVTAASPEDIADVVGRLGIEFTLFADPAGAITQGYGAAAGALAYVLDRNQRVLAVFDDGDVAAALGAIEQAAAGEAEARVVAAQAPVLLIPDVFDEGLCGRLIVGWRRDHFEGGVRKRGAADDSTRTVDFAVKKRLDHNPDDAINRALARLVRARVAPEVFKAFQFQTAFVEKFCVGGYEAGRGDYFRPHRDNTTPRTADRRFAVTVNLNDDYQGGGLRFPEYGDHVYRTAAGGAVVFSCSLLHEALPVTDGARFAALTFLFGPGDKPAPPAAR